VIGQNKKFVAKKKKLFIAKHLSEKMEKIKMGQEIEIKVTWCRALTIILNMSAHITTIILYIEFKKYININ
jgi:ribosomal protein S19